MRGHHPRNGSLGVEHPGPAAQPPMAGGTDRAEPVPALRARAAVDLGVVPLGRFRVGRSCRGRCGPRRAQRVGATEPGSGSGLGSTATPSGTGSCRPSTCWAEASGTRHWTCGPRWPRCRWCATSPVPRSERPVTRAACPSSRSIGQRSLQQGRLSCGAQSIRRSAGRSGRRPRALVVGSEEVPRDGYQLEDF